MASSERKDQADAKFESFLLSKYPQAEITPISSTNNHVFRLQTGKTILSAKLVLDGDIPLKYFAQCSHVLRNYINIQEVIDLFCRVDGTPFDCIVSTYVDGTDLADALARNSIVSQANVVAFLVRYINACAELPRLFDQFGAYRSAGARFSSLHEFLDRNARKYWSRARRFFAADIVRRTDLWIDGLGSLGSITDSYQPVAIDSNLRNFIANQNGDLTLLNVPIVALSSRAHAVGSVSAHLRPFASLRDSFISRATRDWPAEERAAVAHFEAWTLLGILSFYAVRYPERPAEWRNWGSDRNLRDDFASIIIDLSERFER